MRFSLGSKQEPDGAETDHTSAPPILNENALAAPDGAGALMILDIVFSDFDWSLTVKNPITQERIIERRDDRADALSADKRAAPVRSIACARRSAASHPANARSVVLSGFGLRILQLRYSTIALCDPTALTNPAWRNWQNGCSARLNVASTARLMAVALRTRLSVD